MSEFSRRLDQCRKPSGELGKTVAHEMNESHFEMTGWGLNKISIKEDSNVVDIGCGGGRTVNRLAAIALKGKVVGVDYSSDCVEWTRKFNKNLIDQGKVQVYTSTAEKLPFGDKEFDLAIAVETIYFWPNILNCFKEIKRVLKKGGKFAVINEMYLDIENEDEYRDYRNKMNIYTPENLQKLFIDAGYKNVKMEINKDRHWIFYIGES